MSAKPPDFLDALCEIQHRWYELDDEDFRKLQQLIDDATAWQSMIAAAPELLEACKQATSHLGAYSQFEPLLRDRRFVVGLLETAIAKAEGVAEAMKGSES